MNLAARTKISLVYQSTSAFAGSTGDASGGSTALGYPFNSTGIDMTGFETCVAIATFAGTSTGVKVLTASSLSASSAAPATGWNSYTGSTATSGTATASSAASAIVLEIVEPRNRFIGFTASVSSSSDMPTSIVVIQAGKHTQTATPNTTAGLVTATSIVVSPSS